jgi:hypothetical protein
VSIQQIQQLMDLVKFNILGQPYQFAAYFVANWTNFLEPRVNPPFVSTSLGGATGARCFNDRLNGREVAQLQQWQRGTVPRNLRTPQIHYLERQRQNLQQLVDYWDAQFLPMVPSYVGPVNTGSQSGGATLGPGFMRSREFLLYRHVMTRPGGCPPPEIRLGANLPQRYRSLQAGVVRLHRAQLRP